MGYLSKRRARKSVEPFATKFSKKLSMLKGFFEANGYEVVLTSQEDWEELVNKPMLIISLGEELQSILDIGILIGKSPFPIDITGLSFDIERSPYENFIWITET